MLLEQQGSFDWIGAMGQGQCLLIFGGKIGFGGKIALCTGFSFCKNLVNS